MGRDDWYRNSSWDPETAEKFWSRLKRSRSSWNASQYLRIQADLLEKANELEPALELLEYMVEHYPEKAEMASAELCRAKIRARQGRDAEAIQAFRAALIAEAEFPNMRTEAPLAFSEFAVLRRRTDLYSEIEDVLNKFVAETPVLFPVHRFTILAVGAAIEDHRGNASKAAQLATNALAMAAEKHSGFRYHPRVGLIGQGKTGLKERLGQLAAV